MRVVHEPSRMVGRGRDEGVIDVWESPPDFLIAEEVTAVSPVIDRNLGGDEQESSPEGFIVTLAEAPRPMLSRQADKLFPSPQSDFLPPVELLHHTSVEGLDVLFKSERNINH